MIEKYVIKEGIEVLLEDLSDGKGKVIVTTSAGLNYSYFWGAMGGSLKDFILRINSDYFAGKLCYNLYTSSTKKTKTNIRKFIREEFYLPWYKHIEFQKDMREKINLWFSHEFNIEQLTSTWDLFVSSLNFYLIENEIERKCLRKEFESVSEVWHLIEEEPSHEYKLLVDIHKRLQKIIKNEVNNIRNGRKTAA